MPNLFQILVEAKIREWQDRPGKKQAADSDREFQQFASYEKQLLDEIVGLINSANGAPQEAAAAALSSARDLEVQLMASLEKQGLNLTAQRIADEIKAHRIQSMEIAEHAGQISAGNS